MNESAIIHQATKIDCFALDKNQFCLRLKVAKGDISRAYIHVCDKYLSHISKTPLKETILRFPMKKVASDGLHDYFEGILFERVLTFSYFFEIVDTKKEITYYGNFSFHKEKIENLDDMFECAILSRYEENSFSPEWAKGAVGYQIFPDSFARLSSKDEGLSPWNKVPLGTGEFLGGEIKGITAHLTYLKELGVDFLYLNPLFLSTTPHRYNTIDYYKIDPKLGSKRDFITLVKKAHKLGIKVIIDGVFNHVSCDFFAFQDVLAKQEKSRYKDWFYIDDFPIRYEVNERPNFASFAYFGTMPKLNLQNKKVKEYIYSIVKYWMKKAKIDGIRLDVADELPLSFTKELRTVIREINPNALLIGECWYRNTSYLEGDAWDSQMNYPFYYMMKKFFCTHEYRISDVVKELSFDRGHYSYDAYATLWNMLDSHDTPRFLSQCEEKKDFLLAVFMQMTFPGCPLIYYGDEVGLTGYDDPDNRRGMLWDESQDKEILAYYKKLISLRHQYSSLCKGELHVQDISLRNQSITYRRTLDEECLYAFINFSDRALPSPFVGIDLITGKKIKENIEPKQAILVISPKTDKK